MNLNDFSYFATGQLMINGFLQSQGFPKNTHLDIQRPSETLSVLINFAVKKYLTVEVNSTPYIKPAVSYMKDILELGKSREYLQKMNSTELSSKLTDTLNLEVGLKSCYKLIIYLIKKVVFLYCETLKNYES